MKDWFFAALTATGTVGITLAATTLWFAACDQFTITDTLSRYWGGFGVGLTVGRAAMKL